MKKNRPLQRENRRRAARGDAMCVSVFVGPDLVHRAAHCDGDVCETGRARCRVRPGFCRARFSPSGRSFGFLGRYGVRRGVARRGDNSRHFLGRFGRASSTTLARLAIRNLNVLLSFAYEEEIERGNGTRLARRMLLHPCRQTSFSFTAMNPITFKERK